MSTVIGADKHLFWYEMTIAISQIKDGLGMRVDPGILETVVALNVLGIPTRASCEGHLDHGVGAPWVDITSTDPRARIQVGKLFDEALQAEVQKQRSSAEIDALFEEAHRVRYEVKVVYLHVRKKLVDYLIAFYEHHHVPYDVQLIVRTIGTDGKGRLESVGADFQETAPADIKQQKLYQYQQEMQAFTAFLKAQYFL